jgi:hypothetical protein
MMCLDTGPSAGMLFTFPWYATLLLLVDPTFKEHTQAVEMC